MTCVRLLLVLPLLLLPATVVAQDPPPRQEAEENPYAALQDRDIRALAPAEVHGLLEGAGLGMALTAELNGVPGPLHVLEEREGLQLTPEQLEATEALFERMRERASELGEAIVEAEEHLERRFRHRHLDRETLFQLTAEIGQLRGELRAVHLDAHLEMLPILTEEQVERYQELRGYGDPDAMDHGDHHHGDHDHGDPPHR